MVPAVKGQFSWRQGLTAAAAAGTAVSAIHLLQRESRTNGRQQMPAFRIPLPVVDGIAGAVGEVAQICVLYPLETVKVRCQADGISAVQVARNLIGKHGVSTQLLRQLYSGFSAAAGLSLLVGAVHWLSFCAAKRTALDVLPKLQPPATAAQAATTMAAAGSTAPGGVTAGSSQLEPHAQLHHSTHHHMGTLAEGDLTQKTSANAFAAVVGALCTAIVESPIELFRHQAQAGIISGNLAQEMSRAVRNGGPMALWNGFLPFLMEALPYDMSELGSYSQLRDTWDHHSKPGGRLQALAEWIPEHAVDLLVGGCAGAAAVCVSMPFDCIKTYLQTHDLMSKHGALAQVVLFGRTGIRMVRQRGIGALYVGMLPRLVQQVPSSTICWWSVERTGKFLEPWTDRPPGSSGGSMGH